MSAWHKTACILCSVNCGIEVQLDGRRLARVRGDKAHPASRGYTCEKALRLDHYQNGRDRLTTPLRRRADGTLRGDRLGHRDPRDRREARARSATRTAARRSSITAAAGRGITSAAPTRARRARALGSIYTVERARAGEDRRVLGRRPALRPAALPHAPATSSTPRSRCSSARTRGSRTASRARARSCARSPRDPNARADRHRPAPHRDRRARRLSTSRCARAPTRSASRALLARARRRRTSSTTTFLARAHRERRRRSSRALRDVPIADYCARAGVAEDAGARRSRAASRAAESVSIFEDLGIQQAPHSTLNSYLEKLVYLLTGNFAKRGRDEHPHPHGGPRRRQGAAAGRARSAATASSPA